MNLLIIRTRTLLLKLCITILALAASFQAEAQYWELYTIPELNASEDINALIQLKRDRGYLMVGRGPDTSSPNLDPDVFIGRFDIDGRFLWKKYVDNFNDTRAMDVVESEDGQLFIVGEGRQDITSSYNIFVLSLRPDGEVIWMNEYGIEDRDERSHAIALTPDNSLIIAGEVESTLSAGNGGYDAYFMKLDDEGNILWEQNMGYTGDDVAYDVLVNKAGEDDEQYVFTGSTFNPQTENSDIFISIVEQDGTANTYLLNQLNDQDESEEAFSIEKAYEINDNDTILLDNAFIVAGMQVAPGESSDIFYARVRPGSTAGTLDTDWFQINDSGQLGLGDGAECIKHVVGEQYALVAFEEINDFKIGMRLIEFNGQNGNTIGEKLYEHPEDNISTFPKDLVVRPKLEGYAITGEVSNLGVINDPFFFKTGAIGLTFTNSIYGKIFKDDNEDCGFDDGFDIPLKNWRIEARRQSDGKIFTGSSDEDGNYQITVDNGTYDIFYSLKNDHWELLSSCDIVNSLEITGSGESFLADLPVKANSNCAFDYLEINASTLGVDCEAAEADYTIDITNYGPTESTASTVEIILDEKFDFISASLPTTVDANIVSVSIAGLNINEASSFELKLGTSCDDVLDLEAYRLEANIKDAELCDPTNAYNEDSYEVELDCIAPGKVEFTLINEQIGTTELSNYIIIEDVIIYRIEPDEPGSGSGPGPVVIDTISLENGASLRVIVPQPDGHPGRSIPTDFLEGCVDSGQEYNTGYVLNFLENDGDGFTAVDVQENKELPSGNYMEAVPRGLPNNNSISSESAIKYRIYFENNSDNPSKHLTIRDTLPEATTRLQEGSSSHKFNYDLYENNIARFTLDSSETVLAGEQGFLEFKVFVEQEATPCEALENSALIIFENQELIYTNSINTELCGSYAEFVDIVDTPISPERETNKLNIYPNPFIDYSIIELEGDDIYFWSLELYDLNGKLVRRLDSDTDQLVLERNGLESGMYIIKILSDEQIIKTGKLMVH